MRTLVDTVSSPVVPRLIPTNPSNLDHLPRYMLRYYSVTLKSLIRKHSFKLKEGISGYQSEFTLSPEMQKRWFELFEVSEKERKTPFTYFTMAATLLLMRLLGDLGINFKYLLHLKSEMSFNPARSIPEAGESCRVSTVLQEVVQLTPDRIVLVLLTSVHSEDGILLRTNRDYFIILKLNPAYLEKIKAGSSRFKQDKGELGSLSKHSTLLSRTEGVQEVEIRLPAGLGFEYGKISGDLNPVHTTAFTARLFGYKKPFIQGLYLANLVLRQLEGVIEKPLSGFNITFTRPVFVGEKINLKFSGGEFEISREDGKLAAYGKWS